MTDYSKSTGAANSKSKMIGTRIIDADGQSAQIVAVEGTEPYATIAVQPEHGPEIVMPLSLLSMHGNNEYHLPFSFAAMPKNTNAQQQFVIPVVEEQVQIDKRVVDSGKGIRVRKTVSEHEQVVDQPLLQDELIVEHVPVGQIVGAAALPTMRYEGDTLVVPILEEVLVVEKQTRLTEEVRITRRKREIRAPQTVLLKSEQVSIEHFDERNGSSSSAGIPQASSQIKSESGKSAG